MEKKRALIKTRIYNYCISYALLTQRKDYAAKPKSRPIAAKRDGGGVGLPGTASPRKTLAFERWMQQEIAAYQRLISSDGSAYNTHLRSQEKQALKIVRFQRHLPLTIQFYISCRITGVPPLQSDFSGLSSALKDDTNEPKKRKEARTKPAKMARKKSTLRMTRTTTDKLPTYITDTDLR